MTENTPTSPVKAKDVELPFKPVNPDGKYRTGLKVLNSMSGGKTEFIPQNSGRVITWYACGPTTYDAAHMGHARNYVMFDTLRRIMEGYFGYEVRQCMNITDVDDKIIARSNENGENFRDLAAKWEMHFWEDMAEFGVKMPDVITRVSEHIQDIVDFIVKIIENGYAYESNSSVYFDIDAFAKNKIHFYSRMDPSRMVDIEGILEGEGALGDNDESEKKNVRDFALWKRAKPEEPSWESPWGQGRPGWHIECSAMASSVYDFPIDIHSGGIDLKFPHHTNELAQTEAFYDQPQWVNYFMHSGHLHIDGCKMSKSLKNFIIIKECLKEVPARQWRIMFALNRWHAPMNYDPSGTSVNEAIAVDKKFANFFATVRATLRDALKPELNSLGQSQKWGQPEKDLDKAIAETQVKVHEFLCDNLNTVDTLSALGGLVTTINSYINNNEKEGRSIRAPLVQKGARYIYKMLSTMGMATGEDLSYGASASDAQSADAMGPVMDVLAEFRANVRKTSIKVLKAKEVADSKYAAKELLALCDKIRDDDLVKVGITLEDTPNGTIWKA